MSQAMTATTSARDNLMQAIKQWKPWIEKVLPKHVTPERMFKVAMLAANKDTKLWACDPKTVVQSVLTAAQLGLDVGGALGSAYLVPYKTTCTLIIGYRGLIDLARRSGQIVSIEAHVVSDGEEFVVEFGLEPKLIHKPMLKDKPGEIMAAYAVAWLKDGGRQVEVMTRWQIDAIRDRARATEGPWKTDFSEMCRKTVVRRLCKYLPLTPELQLAADVDVAAEAGEAPQIDDVIDVEASGVEQKPTSTVSTLEKRAAALAQKAREQDGGEREPGAEG